MSAVTRAGVAGKKRLSTTLCSGLSHPFKEMFLTFFFFGEANLENVSAKGVVRLFLRKAAIVSGTRAALVSPEDIISALTARLQRSKRCSWNPAPFFPGRGVCSPAGRRGSWHTRGRGATALPAASPADSLPGNCPRGSEIVGCHGGITAASPAISNHFSFIVT